MPTTSLLDQLASNPVALSLAGGLVRIAVLVTFALVLHRLAAQIIPPLVTITTRLPQDTLPDSFEEETKRRETISHVLLRTMDILVIVVVGFMVLSELGFDLAPLLASAGIVGIALGFGAQSLVKDILAGVFILLENQYGRGDVVQIAGASGMVEDINLRRTVLRDLEGVVHSVPNGEIRIASNLTRGWSRVNLNVSVAYKEDLDRVRAVLDRVGEELAADPAWAPMILEAPKVLRVDAFEEAGIALKILATTKPIKQWDVAGELRRRIKAAFDAEGIDFPLQRRGAVLQEEPKAGISSKPASRPEDNANA